VLQVGLGCWKIPKDCCAEAVNTALQNGYRLLDGACDYGNEVQVGQGIAQAVASGIPRKDIFVTSKLWNTFHESKRVREGCMRTLADLGLDYLDLYLIHFPIAMPYVDPADRYPPEWGNMERSQATLHETWAVLP
jgi:D-xylose reductase